MLDEEVTIPAATTVPGVIARPLGPAFPKGHVFHLISVRPSDPGNPAARVAWEEVTRGVPESPDLMLRDVRLTNNDPNPARVFVRVLRFHES